MKVTIKGITPSTLAFNTLGIVVRGDSNDMELYPESIARHIDVINEDQLTEVNSLVNAGFIAVEVEEADVPKRPAPKPADLVNTTPPSAPSIPEVPEASEDDDGDDDGVEDAPVPRKRGRPKGSKDTKPRKTSKKSKSGAKKVDKAKPTETEEPENSTVVVMTPAGAKQGKMYRSATGDVPESDITEASIKAMEKLDEEEELDRNLPDDVIDESKLDPSEQVGLEAVISADGNAAKVKLTNSILPEAKEIKERAVEFIDQDDKDADEAAKQAFVNKQNENDNDDDDLGFLEY